MSSQIPAVTYPIREIYDSIQGEGKHAGAPVTFVRFQGCSVGCAWCDTRYSWEYDDQWIKPVADIVGQCLQRRVVLTGGEPAEFDIKALVPALKDRNKWVSIETSGTADGFVGSGLDWITISPKIGMARPLIREILFYADEIKMPVGKQRDIDRLLEILPFCKDGVYVCLQPISQSKQATSLCIEACLKNDWNLSVQLHKVLGIQ